jgi:hypothetical protein
MALDVTLGGANAQAYGTIAAFAAYCAAVGYDLASYPGNLQEQASVRGVAWLDGYYNNRWPGARLNGRSQARAWPRTEAYDSAGLLISSASIPLEVTQASFEATYTELVKPNSLSPSLVKSQQKVLTEIDGIKWQVAGNSMMDLDSRDMTPTLTVVDRLLSTIVPVNLWPWYKAV